MKFMYVEDNDSFNQSSKSNNKVEAAEKNCGETNDSCLTCSFHNLSGYNPCHKCGKMKITVNHVNIIT